jgi:GT2 family glycosyltransferase
VKLLVVIVNYRVAHLAIDCLHSVAKEIERIPDSHVAVCENGTGDDSAQRIQKAIDDNGWTDWCSLTTLDVNLGFTGGNNAILRPAMQSADPPQYFCSRPAHGQGRHHGPSPALGFNPQQRLLEGL